MRSKIRRVNVGDYEQAAGGDDCPDWKLEVNPTHAPGVLRVLRIIQQNRIWSDVLQLHELWSGALRMIMNLVDDDRSHFRAGVREAQTWSQLGRILGLAVVCHIPAKSHAVFRCAKSKSIGKPSEFAVGIGGKQKNLITMGIEGKPVVIGIELILGENNIASR